MKSYNSILKENARTFLVLCLLDMPE